MAKKILRGPQKSSKKAPKSISQTFLIENELGLHARAAALFVKIASKFKSHITLRKDSNEVNGKSIMGILMLAAARGSRVRIVATGEDAETALQELGELIQRQFGEK